VVFTLVQAGTASRARETGLAFTLLRSGVAEAVSCAWRVAHTACTDAGRAVEAGYAVALAVLARSVAGAQGVGASELDRTVITAPACIANTLAGVVTSPVPATAAPHAAVNAEEAGKTQARAFLAVALVRALVRAYVEARGPAVPGEAVAGAVVTVPAIVAIARAGVIVELAKRGSLFAHVNGCRCSFWWHLVQGDLLGPAAVDRGTAVRATPRILAHAIALEAVPVSVAVGLATDVLTRKTVIRGVADALLHNAESAIVAIILAPWHVAHLADVTVVALAVVVRVAGPVTAAFAWAGLSVVEE
jgi:hypothetical protein